MTSQLQYVTTCRTLPISHWLVQMALERTPPVMMNNLVTNQFHHVVETRNVPGYIKSISNSLEDERKKLLASKTLPSK